jgi:hypothetical protein
MRTLTTTAAISPSHTLTMQVPADIAPGIYDVMLVIQEPLSTPRWNGFFRDWPPHNVALADPTMMFRREDIYGDDGR